jgi:hypothetical protein
MPSNDPDDVKDKHICSSCTSENFLKLYMTRRGTAETCDYCSNDGLCITIESLSELIRGAFKRHYFRTSTEPESWEYAALGDRESEYNFNRKGTEATYAIQEAAEISYDAAEDIRIVLEAEFDDLDSAAMGEETEFSDQSYYKRKDIDDQAWQATWRNFENTLKTEARFFSRSVAGNLL